MRVLGLDYGMKRVGIALSDPMGTIAQPVGFVAAEPFAALLEQLRSTIREQEVELILVGMPRNMDGSYGPAALRVQAFVAALRDAVAIPIKTWDERLSSVQANRFLAQASVKGRARKEKVDQTAAAIVLQSYLDSRAAAEPSAEAE
jgi:putative Holliday junction resolvase